MNAFIKKLSKTQIKNQSLVCVGLDPNIDKISQLGVGLSQWLTNMVDALADKVCAFKPQIAYFSSIGAEQELIDIIAHIHQNYPDISVILDAKRGDIGTTAQQYASEAFERYKADAVTVNPYMGQDSMQPFLDHAHKGVIVLCKTSNMGSDEIQNLTLSDGNKIYQRIAQNAVENWNENNNVLMVVGATYPKELANIRKIVGKMPLLIPGIGAQGGDVKATLSSGLNNDKKYPGLIISSSRGITFASNDKDNYLQGATEACDNLNAIINQHWHK